MEQENEQKASFGLKVLSFFIPLVGLILFACNISNRPKYAKGCGIAALIGFTIIIILNMLIPVFIGGMGLTLYNSAKDTVIESDLRKEAIQAFNSKYELYEGLQTGSRVRTLITDVKINNLDSEENQITVFLDGEEMDLYVSNVIKSGRTYNIEMGYDNNSGYVNQIKITENK